MSDENKDAKENATSDEVNQIAAGGSSALDHPMTNRDSENAFSTVEDDIPGPSPSKDDKGTDKKEPEPDNEAAVKAAEDELKAKGQEARYDKDPAWQRIIQERDDARERIARIEGQLEALKTSVPPKQREEELPYKDITTMSDEELRDWNENDPKGYAANLYSQMRHELAKEHEQLDQTRQTSASVKKTFDDYSSKNPDFMPMWKSGELQKFMADYPGHNAISAHILLTADKRKGETEKEMKERIAKEVKAAEERVAKNFQAKRSASRVLPGGTTVVSPLEETELKDTKQRGGVLSVLAERLKKSRAGTA